MTTYKVKPESFERQKPETGPYASDKIMKDLESVAFHLERVRPNEEDKLFVGLCSHTHGNHYARSWVIINDVRQDHVNPEIKVVDVETVYGGEDFPSWTNGGWAYYNYATVRPASINHCAFIQDGEVIEYLGKPFSKASPLMQRYVESE